MKPSGSVPDQLRAICDSFSSLKSAGQETALEVISRHVNAEKPPTSKAVGRKLIGMLRAIKKDKI